MARELNVNKVVMTGVIAEPFRKSHEVFGEGFYVSSLDVERTSGTIDTIPILVSDRIMDVTDTWVGRVVTVTGQFRSYNKFEGEKYRLILNVFAQSFEENEEEFSYKNEIDLEGYVCKKPTFRKTPKGSEITDLLIASNRQYGKSDFIPCICWGRNATYASKFSVGDRVRLHGRVQSRIYHKVCPNGELANKVVYEVSVSNVAKLSSASIKDQQSEKEDEPSESRVQ